MGRPIDNSFTVIEGKVYAGEYPGDPVDARPKIGRFLKFGITHFIDLTEEGELEPYAGELPFACTHVRFPIPDLSVPEDCRRLENILQFIDDVATDPSGNKVYIHCHGGVGRTGTVVACLYEYLGEDFDTAVARLRRNFRQCPKSLTRPTPDTPAQLSFIRTFAAHLHRHGPDKI